MLMAYTRASEPAQSVYGQRATRRGYSQRSRTMTSRAVSALVTRRLLVREHRREGRGIRITLTTRGTAIYSELMASALERNRVLLHGMDGAETIEFFKILDRLTALARAILDQEQRA